MLSQKAAVYAAVQSVFAQSGNLFTEGTKISLSKEERATVTQIVSAGIASGDVAFSTDALSKYDTAEKLKSYVTGMVGNWLTKDVRLNGGDKYQPENPGSRAGQGDEVISNLRALRTTLTDAIQLEAVDVAIEQRKLELTKAKIKKVEVNFDSIPQDLLEKLNLG